MQKCDWCVYDGRYSGDRRENCLRKDHTNFVMSDDLYNEIFHRHTQEKDQSKILSK